MQMSLPPVIIEFTGSPGVGKTSRAVKGLERLDTKVVVFSDDMVLSHHRLGFVTRPRLRRMLADLILLSVWLRHMKEYGRLIKYVLGVLRKNRERLFVKINVLRNVLLKIARHEFTLKTMPDRTVIFDEGLSHIPFNLIDYSDNEYGAKVERSLACTLSMIEKQLKRINVIVVVREDSEVRRSVRDRGHKRLKGRGRYTVDEFTTYNRLLSDEYVRLAGGCFMSKIVYRLR